MKKNIIIAFVLLLGIIGSVVAQKELQDSKVDPKVEEYISRQGKNIDAEIEKEGIKEVERKTLQRAMSDLQKELDTIRGDLDKIEDVTIYIKNLNK